jgi:uncharacterized membrane protein HdeD (DUF308 family)
MTTTDVPPTSEMRPPMEPPTRFERRPPDQTEHHLRFKNWRWWTVALRGVAAIVFGVLALIAPTYAFLSLVILFGIFAIADGVLAFALGATPLVSKGAMYARGVISIAAGVIALVWPQITGLALLFVIAAWAVAAGIVEIVMAIRLRKTIEHEWLLGVEGVLSIVFGVLLFMAPLAGAIVLGLWVGIYALILGGMLVATGLRLRSAEHAPLSATPAAA